MSKELKDYLHLYLGCECKMIKPSYHAVHELHLSSDRTFILTGKLYDYFSSDTTKAEIKPILRPLSDMMDEEINQCWEILDWSMVVQNNRRRLLMEEFEDRDEASEVNGWVSFCKVLPYLLSKHLDLFGLVEAGLAIDKTKHTVVK